jgi:hypothetical protein
MPEMKGHVNLSLRQSPETALEATNGDHNHILIQRVGAVQATSAISMSDGSRSSTSLPLRKVCGCLAGTWRCAGCEDSRLLPNPIVVMNAEVRISGRGQ